MTIARDEATQLLLTFFQRRRHNYLGQGIKYMYPYFLAYDGEAGLVGPRGAL